jgi:hypothetical protein
MLSQVHESNAMWLKSSSTSADELLEIVCLSFFWFSAGALSLFMVSDVAAAGGAY